MAILFNDVIQRHEELYDLIIQHPAYSFFLFHSLHLLPISMNIFRQHPLQSLNFLRTMSTSSTSKPSWALQSPYKPASPSSPYLLRASCHCTQVQYVLHADKPLAAKFCHCSDCQAIHGAPFQWAAIFHKDAISFPDLDPAHLKFYKSSTGEEGKEGGKPELPVKVACRKCGSWLFDEGRNMLLLFPAAIKWPNAEAREKFDVQ